MKILHVTEVVFGGTSTVLRLNMLGQTQILGSDNVTALVSEEEATDLTTLSSDQVETFSQTGRNVISFLSLALSFFKIVRRDKPDIIHLHSSFAGIIGRLMMIPVRLCTSKYRPKIVYCPHAFGFLIKGSNTKKKIYAFIEKLLLPLTDAVICVSEYERRAAGKYGLPSHKMHVIYNGVYVPASITPIKKSKDVLDLLFLGRLDYQKGFDLLLSVMEELEGEPFFLTVVGDSIYSDEKPPERPNIRYEGWANPEKIPAYFVACNLVVMPSRWESFGLVAAEAGAYGRACLASDCCSLPEITKDSRTGRLFSIDNSAEMVEILRNTSFEDWEKMGYEANKRIAGMFSIDKMVEETMALYKKLATH
jgi:glycosyltransferase involved in cell wall biosynthesis